MRPQFLVALLVIFLIGCDINQEITYSSGTVNNPYIEEPLTKNVEKYQNALAISNKIAERLIEGDIEAVYLRYFSEKLRKSIAPPEFEYLVNASTSYSGGMLSYKPMQWRFTLTKVEGQDTLISTKFLQYEKNKVSLTLYFLADSNYREIEGLALNAIE